VGAAVARLVQISLPLNLAAKLTNSRLRVGLHQQPKSRFHHSLFCPRSCAAHRLLNQLVVDLDVCPHR
jgi:hypothetical protein